MVKKLLVEKATRNRTITNVVYVSDPKLALYLKYIEENRKFLDLEISYVPVAGSDITKKHFCTAMISIVHETQEYSDAFSLSASVNTTQTFSFTASSSHTPYNIFKPIVTVPDKYLKSGNVFDTFFTGEDVIAKNISLYIAQLQEDYKGVLPAIDMNAKIDFNIILGECFSCESNNVSEHTVFVFVRPETVRSFV